jgi:Xaa-Pro aminopeptidase
MKRVSNNYQCVNALNETYTGKEMSPKGIGFSAVAYEIGFEKEGVDKQLWVVQIKNGKKVWFRKSGMPKVTHEEPLITNDVIKEVSSPVPVISEVKEEVVKPEEVKKEEPSQKKSDFNIFYKYYSNILKEENIREGLNKKPKTIQEETYAEWNRIKKNKSELNELLECINKKVN